MLIVFDFFHKFSKRILNPAPHQPYYYVTLFVFKFFVTNGERLNVGILNINSTIPQE